METNDKQHDAPRARSAPTRLARSSRPEKNGTSAGYLDTGIPFMPPAVAASRGLTPRDVLYGMARHWKKCTLFVIGMLALVFAVLMAAPRSYSSEAKLFVRVGRETVALDPTATTGATVPLLHDHEYELNSIVELLQSRALIEKVVDRLGPRQVLNPPAWKPSGSQADRFPWLKNVRNLTEQGVGLVVAWFRRLEPVSDRERAIHLLQRSISVRVPKRSNVACIECRAKTPKLAQNVVSTLVDAYVEEHLQVHKTPGAYEFFSQQSTLLHSQLVEATEALSAAKNEMGLLSIDSQQQLLHDQLAANLQGRLQAEASLAAARGRIAGLDAALAVVKERIPTDQVAGFDNHGSDLMRRDLYGLELREAQLRALYRDDDPRLAVLREQLQEARQVYGTEPNERTQATTTINPTWQSLQLDRLSEQARADALEAELAELKQQHEELVQKREVLNQNAVRLAAIQREVDTLETNYRLHVEHLEQSRINQALEEERISNVNIAEPATFVTKPVSPNIPLVLLLGCALAFGGAGLLPLCWEHLFPPKSQAPARMHVVAAVPSPNGAGMVGHPSAQAEPPLSDPSVETVLADTEEQAAAKEAALIATS